jgi:antitoxin PrlF
MQTPSKHSTGWKLTARVRTKNQVTLPQAICEAAGLTEGEYLSFSVAEKRKMVPPGSIIVQPQQLANRPWTKAEWKAKEAEADADIKAGRVSGPFDTVEDTLKALKKKRK